MDDAKILFPGRKVAVEITDGQAVEYTVYTLGVRHLRQFEEAIRNIADVVGRDMTTLELRGAISTLVDGKVKASEMAIGEIVCKAVPRLVSEIHAMLSACVKGPHPIDDLPHWCFPPLAQAWIEESFSDSKKIRPWLDMAEGVLEQVAGKKINLKELLSGALSKSSQNTDTPPAT